MSEQSAHALAAAASALTEEGENEEGAPRGTRCSSTNTSTTPAVLDRVRASLERALASNRQLQATILSKMASLARRKAVNRAKAERLHQHFCSQSALLEFAGGSRDIARQDDANLAERNDPQETPRMFSSSDDWRRPFFTGPEGETPEPNPDALHRHRLEAEAFFEHTQAPWSEAEAKILKKLLQEWEQERTSNATMPEEEEGASMDYDALARQLHDALPPKLRESRPPRTAAEVELAWQSLRRRGKPWTKAESVKLLELVHASDQSSDPRDWADIASSLSNDGSHQRSAWECLVAYQTRFRPVGSSTPWTLAQDQLLLKYAAAVGPQAVLSTDTVAHLSATLFPDKTRAQIAHRLHHSLGNPKLSNDPWTADEERKLVVLMKVYHDSTSTPPDRTSPDHVAANPPSSADSASTNKTLNLVARHFPHRSSKSVTDKWRKSLDPAHSSLPFTAHEDQRLVDLVNQHPDVGWSELCERFFPDRHPERIAKRWADLADDSDILARSWGAAAATAAKPRNRFATEEASSQLIKAEDFTVQVKKKVKH